MNGWREIVLELIDNDTLIIIGVLILASLYTEVSTEVVAGLLGYMKGKTVRTPSAPKV